MAFPIRKLLLVSLLSALGSAGALAAEQSHFEHFITVGWQSFLHYE